MMIPKVATALCLRALFMKQSGMSQRLQNTAMYFTVKHNYIYFCNYLDNLYTSNTFANTVNIYCGLPQF